MNSPSAQLSQLLDELHEVNRELAEAAHPLERLSDLNDERRRQIGERIRAGLARWDDVSARIANVLRDGPEDRRGTPP